MKFSRYSEVNPFAVALETFGFSFTVVAFCDVFRGARNAWHFSLTVVVRRPMNCFSDPIREHVRNRFGEAIHHVKLVTYVEMVRFELMTPCLQGRCSPN